MLHLPVTSDSMSIEVLVSRGDAFTQKSAAWALGSLVEIDQQSSKAVAIPAGRGDPNPHRI